MSPAQICVKTLSQVLALRVGYTELYKGRIQTNLKGGWVAGLPPIRINPSNLDTMGLFFSISSQVWYDLQFAFNACQTCKLVGTSSQTVLVYKLPESQHGISHICPTPSPTQSIPSFYMREKAILDHLSADREGKTEDHAY
jgi:hypothetical protein